MINLHHYTSRGICYVKYVGKVFTLSALALRDYVNRLDNLDVDA